MFKKIVILTSIILWPLNLFLNFNKINFSSQTVFQNDYQQEQLILRNIHLYPSVIFARTFQDKPRIYINKYLNNFFAIIDLNNYFFALHPEPITGNVNMFKFPFLDIAFFLVGVFYISKSKYKKIILFIVISSVFVLSCLRNFEGFDFVFWIPMSLIISNGINILEYKNKIIFKYYSIVFILFAIPEILRSFFNH